MSTSTAENGKRERRATPWLLLAVTVIVIVCGVCALSVYLLTRPPVYRVTPYMERTATQALENPEAAPLNLSENHYFWYPPDRGAYAVEDNVVIFPQRERVRNIKAYMESLFPPDLMAPAVVFAPDGSDPTTLPPDIDRSWYNIGEWYLVDCQPIEDKPLWWQCVLILGGNI